MTKHEVSFETVSLENMGRPPVVVLEAPQHAMTHDDAPVCTDEVIASIPSALKSDIKDRQESDVLAVTENAPHQASRNRFLSTRAGKITASLAGALAFTAVGAPAASARYNSMGPALTGNVQQELDFALDKTGSCSPLKDRLAKLLNLRTQEGIDKYLNGANVDAGRKFIARNSGKNAWKGNSAASGCVSVPIKNNHKTSVAYKILFDKIPAQAVQKFKQLPNGKFELRTASIRGLCTNVLNKKLQKKAKKARPSNDFDMDVSHGVSVALAIAAAEAKSTANQEVSVTCPDGTTVSSSNYANARSDALAAAAVSTRQPGQVVFKRKDGNSFAAVMVAFNNKVNELAAIAGATAEANVKQKLTVNCGPNQPPPVNCPPGSIKPECNPPVVNQPPTTQIDNPNHVGTNDVIAVCEIENDPDDLPGVNTIASRVFRIVNGGGNFVSVIYPGNDPKEFCQDYRGPSTDTATSGSKVTLSVKVTDKGGLTNESFTAPFPVVTLPV